MCPASRWTARPGIRSSNLPRRPSPRRGERSRPDMEPTRPSSGANGPGSRGAGLLARSLKRHWKRYREQMKRCHRKWSSGGIHAFRAETRRLLSTVELLGGFLPARQVEKARRLLKRHLDVFADLRDTQ